MVDVTHAMVKELVEEIEAFAKFTGQHVLDNNKLLSRLYSVAVAYLKIMDRQTSPLMQIGRDIHAEVLRARSLHQAYHSPHEAFSILYEEVHEFWDEVRVKREHRSRENMRTELVHVAAVAVRAIEDLNLGDPDGTGA